MRPVSALLGAVPAWAVLLAILCAGVGFSIPQADARPREAVAKDARLAGDRGRTRFIADLSKKVDVNVFSLADPYRVIVDLPEVNFQMPPGLGTEKRGLVTGYRYGLFAPGKSRIVIDVSGPFLVDKAFVLEARADQPARVVVDLVATDRTTFLAKLRAARSPIVGSIPQPKPQAQTPAAKPVVILDPGHGGIDPGTASADGVTEKAVVLAFAKTLRQKLEAKGDYQVYLTREGDTFLALRERVEFAQSKGANLFVSIHADSFPKHADVASGATVYTLSERASDDEAKELAAKENFSDAIAGVDLPADRDEVVANILIDLAQRETQNRSIVFARSVVGEMSAAELHRKSLKSAGFRVLKSPDVPSVLLELGFLSNPDDEKRLTSEAWRGAMADKVGAAIDAYFAKRVARMPF
ncbi:N-acetylmuramoyl-L-alanine amidase [Methyloceanibacter sp.]|uniref:N-acetylmuramoyl-L-alanine amidase n=1 Tax=Methyloceanibacter sp. TaxID=1965321 RepID=UPI003D6D046E